MAVYNIYHCKLYDFHFFILNSSNSNEITLHGTVITKENLYEEAVAVLMAELQEDPINTAADFNGLEFKEGHTPLYGRSPYVSSFINILAQNSRHVPRYQTSSGIFFMLSEEEMQEFSVFIAEHRDRNLIFEDAVWLYYSSYIVTNDVKTKKFCSGVLEMVNTIDFVTLEQWKTSTKSTLDH